MTYQTLLELIDKHELSVDKARLQQIYNFAAKVHQDQVRYTGDSFITHPLAVAAILVELRQTQPVVEAALLHETIETGNTTLDVLRREFGDEVAFLVEGVTKVGRVKLRASTEKAFVENVRKMFVAMAQDIRVVLIRLADRLHNMQTLEGVPLDKQKRIALETLEVYAPLAERLGIGQIKHQLEDLAFPYAYPAKYRWLVSIAQPHFKHAESVTKKHIHSLQERLTKEKITAQVHGRPKGKYSLYCKLMRPEVSGDITKIYDLIALRIITNSQKDCYAALGIVHDHWKPVPHIGVSDFIAQPKPNGYQSIHTKVFDQTGRIIEIQIRTNQMHHQAEYGAAAHYAYAEAKNHGVNSRSLQDGTAFRINDKMAWIKQLANWQEEVSDSREFAHRLKLDALSHRIYVFSPKGDVYDLPAQATPIDFAYGVHTNLIFHIQAVKVNGRVVPLDYSLQSGDMVEIIKTKNRRSLSRDWLQIVKTHGARSFINKFLRLNS